MPNPDSTSNFSAHSKALDMLRKIAKTDSRHCEVVLEGALQVYIQKRLWRSYMNMGPQLTGKR